MKKFIIVLFFILVSKPVFSQGLVWGPDTYNAKVYRVVDGDTAYLIVDLGLDVSRDLKVRFKDIDAPEIRGSEKIEGLKSKKALVLMIEGKNIVLVVNNKKSFDRWIGTIFLEGININLWLVRSGHAETSKR